MLQKQSELDPRSLLRPQWFSHTFESMTLLRLDILAAKTVMTVASHCGRCGGEAVVSTVTNKSSSSPYGFVVIGARICVQEKFIFLSPKNGQGFNSHTSGFSYGDQTHRGSDRFPPAMLH